MTPEEELIGTDSDEEGDGGFAFNAWSKIS